MRFGTESDVAAGGLCVTQLGFEACHPGHAYGPATRDYYLIHLIESGRGRYTAGGKTYTLSRGQGFIIFPGQITLYQADFDQPWRYGWIGYAGVGAAALTRRMALSSDRPVFSLENVDALLTVIRTAEEEASVNLLGELCALGGLYRFMGCLAQQLTARGGAHAALASHECYAKALWYINGQYARPIRVTDVAAFVGLSRSQLFRVFKAYGGLSPQAYLNQARLNAARDMLTGTSLSIEQIARSTGFSSAERLGKMFRQKYALAPLSFRKRERAQGQTKGAF